MPRIITVASQKGGVGKTTTAVNLASCLGLAGREVLLLDFDPQSNATSGVGVARVENENDYLSALLRGESIERFLRRTAFDHLGILPASPELSRLELVQELLDCPPRRLRDALELSAESYDFVLIDCPPSLRGPPTIALHLSDAVIIPVQCEYYAMEGLSQILPIVKKAQKKTNMNLQIEGLLLTMFSPELDLSHEVVEEVAGYFGGQAFRTVVPRDVTLAEAASHGQPAVHYAPLSRGAWSYVELAREVLSHGETQAG